MSQGRIKEKLDESVIPTLLEGCRLVDNPEMILDIMACLEKKIDCLQEKLSLKSRIKEELERVEMLNLDDDCIE